MVNFALQKKTRLNSFFLKSCTEFKFIRGDGYIFMTQRLCIALAILAVIIGTVIWGTWYISDATKEMEPSLDKMIKSLLSEEFDVAKESFEEFNEIFEKRKGILSVFLHDSKINNVEASINKLKDLFDSEFLPESIPEAENLLDSIGSIRGDNMLSLDKLF